MSEGEQVQGAPEGEVPAAAEAAAPAEEAVAETVATPAEEAPAEGGENAAPAPTE